jgi:predicted dehydrogenase
MANGALPLYDMPPYYLTALVNLFGPAQRVAGFFERSAMLDGAGGSEDVVAASASVEFSGLVAQLSFVWGADLRDELPFLAVFGTDGEVRLPNPNVFDGPATVRKYSEAEWHELPGSRQEAGLPANLRGLGVSDLARAIRDRRPARAGGEIAAHVVEVSDAIVSSAQAGRRVELKSSCVPAAPLTQHERRELLAGLLVASSDEGDDPVV